MVNSKKSKERIRVLVLGAVMTALVVILQSVGSTTTFFGPFSTAVALVPIVIGAAMCGTTVGAWLGFVFGVVVMATGGANLFFAFDVPGTVVTVLVKGVACGAAAGLVCRLLLKVNRYLAVAVAAVVCPVVNTSVFLLGCRVFFMAHADAIAANLELNISGMALFWALAMGNFLCEVLTSVVLSPVIVRILNIERKMKS